MFVVLVERRGYRTLRDRTRYRHICGIQWLMRFKPAWFRHDLLALLDLLKEGKIKPLIAQRLPLDEARRAHEMLGDGGVLGKIVLLPNG